MPIYDDEFEQHDREKKGQSVGVFKTPLSSDIIPSMSAMPPKRKVIDSIIRSPRRTKSRPKCDKCGTRPNGQGT